MAFLLMLKCSTFVNTWIFLVLLHVVKVKHISGVLCTVGGALVNAWFFDVSTCTCNFCRQVLLVPPCYVLFAWRHNVTVPSYFQCHVGWWGQKYLHVYKNYSELQVKVNIEQNICFRKIGTLFFYPQSFVFDLQCWRAEGHMTVGFKS
jgi:hypothetical protein